MTMTLTRMRRLKRKFQAVRSRQILIPHHHQPAASSAMPPLPPLPPAGKMISGEWRRNISIMFLGNTFRHALLVSDIRLSDIASVSTNIKGPMLLIGGPLLACASWHFYLGRGMPLNEKYTVTNCASVIRLPDQLLQTCIDHAAMLQSAMKFQEH